MTPSERRALILDTCDDLVADWTEKANKMCPKLKEPPREGYTSQQMSDRLVGTIFWACAKALSQALERSTDEDSAEIPSSERT